MSHCAGKEVVGGGEECPIPGLNGGGMKGPTGQAMAGVYGVRGKQALLGQLPRSSDNNTVPRTASMRPWAKTLYDQLVTLCPQQFCRTGFMISPVLQVKRLGSSLLPLATSHRLRDRGDRAGGQGRDDEVAR